VGRIVRSAVTKHYADFQHSVSVAVKPLPYRFCKNRVRSCRCCWGLCAVIARQAQDAGRVKKALSFPRKRVGGAAGPYEWRIRKNRSWSSMNRWTATANLRKRRTLFFYVSYGVLTESLRMNVILTYFCNGQRRYGNGGTDTSRWKPRIRGMDSQMVNNHITPWDAFWGILQYSNIVWPLTCHDGMPRSMWHCYWNIHEWQMYIIFH